MHRADFVIVPMTSNDGNDFLVCEVHDATYWGVSYRGGEQTHVFQTQEQAEGYITEKIKSERRRQRFTWDEGDIEPF